MENNIFILKWIKDFIGNKMTSVTFIYIKDSEIRCSMIILNNSEFEQFRKTRNKHLYYQKNVSVENTILDELISDYDDSNEFIKNNKLEKKIREYKIKKLLYNN